MSCDRSIPGVDPADRLVHRLGEAAQFDLWFPEPVIPVGVGQVRMLPVLVMTLTFSRFLSTMMIPSRQPGDLLAGGGATYRIIRYADEAL